MKIAILGCGVMGSAIARQLVLNAHDLILCDHSSEKAVSLAKELQVTFASSPAEAIQEVDVIFLAIKPKDLQALSEQISPTPKQMLISILGGTPLSILNHLFPSSVVVRAMPNLALICQQSVVAIAKDPDLSEEKIQIANEAFKDFGLLYWTTESQLEAISALAGSGPAFMMAIIESLIESGIAMGLSSSDARLLVLQMITGSVALLHTSNLHPAQIRWQICSPAGTTIAGMQAFEASGVRSGIFQTILATYHKAKELL